MRRDIDGGEIGIDAAHASHPGQGVGTAIDNLRLPALGQMFHHHQRAPGADRQVHRASHGRNRIRRTGVPVGKVAGDRHLECAQHAEVEVPATHHRKRVRVVEIGAAGQQRDRLLAGIDQVPVFLAFGRRRTHAENAVLALQEHLAVDRQVVRHQGGQADAEVDIGPLWNVLRDPRRDLVARAPDPGFLHDRAHAASLCVVVCAGSRATITTRLTKIPGVTTTSGSSSPSATVS